VRTFNLDDAEIEFIQDLRKLGDLERRVFTNAIHRSAEDREPQFAKSSKIVPLVLPK
jgi:hypothetical protein